MKIRALPLVGAFVSFTCAAGAGMASVPTSIKAVFDLKPAEGMSFQQIACTDRYGVLLEMAEASSETGKKSLDDSKYVYATCRPHRWIERQPVKYLVECRRSDFVSPWECEPGRETMRARVGGILVNITIGDGSVADLDRVLATVKYLRSSGQLKDKLVEDSQVPGEEGFANCHTFPRYSDRVEMVRCFGVNDVPVAQAQELQP